MSNADVGEPALQTTRLLVRRLRVEDAEPIAAYRSLPEVARFQSWETYGLAQATTLVTSQADVVPNTPGTWLQLALVLTASGAVIGDCGIHFRADDLQQVEIGFTLAPMYWGRGLATEAVRAVLEYVFETLGKHRVSAVTDTANYAAASLLRRLGFRQEAHHIEHVWYKGGWGSEYVFALLQREWQR